MQKQLEYIQLFMEFESEDMPVVYFYEVDQDNERFALRAMEVFSDGRVNRIEDLYRDAIELEPIPTVDEFNKGAWGKGFSAITVSKDRFDEIWNAGIIA